MHPLEITIAGQAGAGKTLFARQIHNLVTAYGRRALVVDDIDRDLPFCQREIARHLEQHGDEAVIIYTELK